jgi:hypothetical protein
MLSIFLTIGAKGSLLIPSLHNNDLCAVYGLDMVTEFSTSFRVES